MTVIIWFILPIICLIAAAIYLYQKIKAAVLCFATRWLPKNQRIITIVVTLLLIVPAIRIFGIWFIVLLHLIVFLLITDGIVIIIKKSRKNKNWSGVCKKIYCSGVIAVVLTAVVIGYGRYNIFHVVRTEYTLQTQKDLQTEGYRLVLLSDLHYGVSMSDEQLQKVADRISRENPDIVVLGFDTTLTYDKLAKACHYIRHGCLYYGINQDLNCPIEGGEFIPDCGAMARLIEASTGRYPEFFGKPTRHTLDYIVEHTGNSEEEIAIVGDRLYTDIAVAKGSKARSILVLTGESNLRDVVKSETKPGMILNSLEDLTSLLTEGEAQHA